MSLEDLWYSHYQRINELAAQQIARRFGRETATIEATSTVSTAMDFRNFAGGLLLCPADLADDTLTFKAASLAGTTPASTDFFDVFSAGSTTLLSIKPGTGWNYLPDNLFPAHWVKVVTNNATTGAVTLVASLKG